MVLLAVNGWRGLDSVNIDNIPVRVVKDPFISRSNCRNCFDTLDAQHGAIDLSSEISTICGFAGLAFALHFQPREDKEHVQEFSAVVFSWSHSRRN
jgi:hypothetical protein